MSLPSPHEALIYLMVITSAADREMTDVEMARIGNVLKTWPIFQDFDDWKLIRVAQECQQRLQAENGLESILADVAAHLAEAAARHRLCGGVRGGDRRPRNAHGGASRARD